MLELFLGDKLVPLIINVQFRKYSKLLPENILWTKAVTRCSLFCTSGCNYSLIICLLSNQITFLSITLGALLNTTRVTVTIFCILLFLFSLGQSRIDF